VIFANYKFFFFNSPVAGRKQLNHLISSSDRKLSTNHIPLKYLYIGNNSILDDIYIYGLSLWWYIYIHMILDHYRSHLWHRAYWYRPVINIQISAGDVQVQPANGDVASLGQWTGWVEGLIQHSLLVPMGYIVNILYNSYYGTNIVNNSSYCNSMIYLLVIRTMVASIRSHGLFNLWFGGKKPSGKHTKSYGKSTQFLIGKSTISMGHFQ